MAAVDRVIVVWNNDMWPIPSCILCEPGGGGGGGEGGGGGWGEDKERAAVWEAGGKIAVVLPPPPSHTSYAACSLNNRFLPYNLIRTE